MHSLRQWRAQGPLRETLRGREIARSKTNDYSYDILLVTTPTTGEAIVMDDLIKINNAIEHKKAKLIEAENSSQVGRTISNRVGFIKFQIAKIEML